MTSTGTASRLSGKWIHDEEKDSLNRYAKLKLQTDYRLPSHLTSVLLIKTAHDNRNSSYFEVSGYRAPSTESGQEDKLTDKQTVESRRHWADVRITPDDSELENQSPDRVEGQSGGIASTHFLGFNCTFDKVELGATSYWSAISPNYRFVVLHDRMDLERCIETSRASGEVFRVRAFEPGLDEDQQLRAGWELDGHEAERRQWGDEREIRPQVWVIPSHQK